MNPYEQRLLSRPVKLRWAGWEADTLSLQQHGWQISAHQDVCRMQMGLAIRHDQFGSGITSPVDWRFMEDHWDRQLPTIPMWVMGRQVSVHTMNTDFSAYRPVDAYPQMAARAVQNLEDLVHFAPNLARTREIIIPEESVDDLMKRILDLQQPARTDRIKASLREGPGEMIATRERQTFHAQILSIAA